MAIDPTDFTTAQYAAELAKVKILSREEELAYFKEYKENGDLKARDKMIESCLRFVVKIAQKYSRGYGVERKKLLISAGNEGLLVAIDRYDPTRGTRFLSYAAWYVILFIREEIHKDATVPVPTWRKKSARKLRKMQESFVSSHGYEPTVEELAAAVSLSEKQVRSILNSNHIVFPLHTGESENMLQAEIHQKSLEDTVVDSQGSEALDKILATLPVREQFILRTYYGLAFDEPLSLKQIASMVGISSEWVRQIKAGAIKKLKSNMRAYGIESIDDILS